MAKRTVKMLRNPAKKYGCDLTEGQTGDVDVELADALMKDGIAVLPPSEEIGEPEKPKLQAVPPAPSIGTASKKADK